MFVACFQGIESEEIWDIYVSSMNLKLESFPEVIIHIIHVYVCYTGVKVMPKHDQISTLPQYTKRIPFVFDDFVGIAARRVPIIIL